MSLEPAPCISHSQMESPYDVLGVSRTATKQAIKQAFRTLCTKVHPDKGGDLGSCWHLGTLLTATAHLCMHAGDPARFLQLQEAFEVLSDEGRRRDYDSSGLVLRDADQQFAATFGSGLEGPVPRMLLICANR